MFTAITSTGAAAPSHAPVGSPSGLDAGRAQVRRAGGMAPPGTVAVLLATAATEEDGPAAALPLEGGGTLLRRTLDQFADLGVAQVHVITRPEFEAGLRPELAGAGAPVKLETSRGPADDLRLIGEAARSAPGPIAIAVADILTHREVLAGLLADPRLATAALMTVTNQGRPFAPRVRTMRGRVLAAASPYHTVRKANASFLGVIKVAPADREALVAAAEQAAELAAEPNPEWRDELEAKRRMWRRWLADRASYRERGESAPEEFTLAAEEEAEVARRAAMAPDDVASLLLVALVRSGARVGVNHLRKFFWARPSSAGAAAEAWGEISTYDEDRLLLESAVKGSDGFFTTFFVSTHSKYYARWAARRGLHPNTITLLSLVIGVAAATAFATGSRTGLIVGGVLAYLSFVTDCVDGQLARYTRTFSKLGAWLDSVCDRAKEYVILAGLALGADHAGDDVWTLAVCALALQTLRHALEFSSSARRQAMMAAQEHQPLAEPGEEPGMRTPQRPGAGPPRPEVRRTPLQRLFGLWRAMERVPGVLWLKKMVVFPIGERFAVISISAAVASPRTTFTILLAWGSVAALYAGTGRLLRTLAAGSAAGAHLQLRLYRDDGPLARVLGAVGARLPLAPAPLVLLAAAPVLALAVAEWGTASQELAGAALAWAVVLAGLAAGRPHDGRFAFTVPPLLRVVEYAAVLWIASLASEPALAGAFAFLAAATFRHYDVVYRLRHQAGPPPQWVESLGLGWDGRIVVAFLLLVAGAVPEGLYAAGALLGVMFLTEAIVSWVRFNAGTRRVEYEEDEEDEGQ